MQTCVLIAMLVLAACGIGGEPYRPRYHFSPGEHWTNDPNGLAYFEGEYHLFLQFNCAV